MEQLEIKKISGAVEALLFIHGEPLELKKIAETLNIEKEQVKEALDNLDQALKNDERGLYLIFHGSMVQLATKSDFSTTVEKIIKDEYEENLTPAALETLSLVGYLGPISRSQIDYYRGVNSSYTLRNLMMRGLVEKVSNPEKSHTVFYGVSFDLLRHLGISKIEELPDYHKFQTILVNNEESNVAGNNTNLIAQNTSENGNILQQFNDVKTSISDSSDYGGGESYKI